MTPDPLDELLDRSAPATRAADDAALRTMMADAAREVPRRRRRRRVAIAAGALAAVLIGGAGVATATDGFRWAPWAQDPLGAVSFTMDSGFDCELRFSPFAGGADPMFVGQANAILEDWYRSTDVPAAAKAHLDQTIQDHDFDMALALEPGETWESLPPDEAQHRRWATEWLLWDLVVSDLESEELERRGIARDDARFADSTRSGQIQCFDEDGEPYLPGAGS